MPPNSQLVSTTGQTGPDRPQVDHQVHRRGAAGQTLRKIHGLSLRHGRIECTTRLREDGMATRSSSYTAQPHGAKAASYYVGTRPVGEWAKQEHTLPPRDMRTDEAVQLRNQRMQEPVGAWMATERSTRSSASTDGPQSLSGRRLFYSKRINRLQPGAKTRTTGRIAKPPPPMPPMERWSGIPEGLRLALQALTDSEKNWDRPPGSEPIYWVQVGSRM